MKINGKNLLWLNFNERKMIKPTLAFPNKFEVFLLDEFRGNYFVFFLRRIIIMKFQMVKVFSFLNISYIFLNKELKEVTDLEMIKM